MKTFWASQYSDKDLNQALWSWASLKIFGQTRSFGPCCTMGVEQDGELKAVVVLHNHDTDAGVIEMSAASDSKLWLQRSVLYEMFSRAFNNIGCQMVVLRVSPENKNGNRGLHRILKAYGFECYEIPRLRGRNKSDLLFTLTDDAWRSNGFHT